MLHPSDPPAGDGSRSTSANPVASRQSLDELIANAGTPRDGFSGITLNQLERLLHDSGYKSAPMATGAWTGDHEKAIVFVTLDGKMCTLHRMSDHPHEYEITVAVKDVKNPTANEVRDLAMGYPPGVSRAEFEATCVFSPSFDGV